ncbi:MAG: LamG domain-containing protein, partial [Opitutaceae bacterium]
MKNHQFVLILLFVFCGARPACAETVALWLFDEPLGLYPSHTLDSSAGLDAPMVLGPGGMLVEGRFGRALSTRPHPPVVIPKEGEATASLDPLPVPPGRTQPPLTWHHADFCALMTSGERHLRKEVSFVNPTEHDLNLGDFDWTVEFWFRVGEAQDEPGVVFEIGAGPRGENDVVTRLVLDAAAGGFVLFNAPMQARARMAIAGEALRDGAWHHAAFVYADESHSLRHYIDGREIASSDVALRRLPLDDEAYMSVGRDGLWGRPFPGALDEMRISRGEIYTSAFTPPESFALPVPEVKLVQGEPLLFAPDSDEQEVVDLGGRKHVFWDDALLEPNDDITFRVHPPRRVERVIEEITGQFRKHLTVIEDKDGLIRIYNGVTDDYLGVRTSRDGVHFEIPDTGIHHKGNRNIVIAEPAPLGTPIIDPNGPPEHRWKYISGLEGRGVYLYTSPDGWKWKRHRTAVLPFRSGSQSGFFYDEQRGLYAGYHRTGFPRNPAGGTRREFVLAETSNVYEPWPFTPMTQKEVWEVAKTRPLRSPQPWWLDNGPLTPGDFGVELPTVFAPDDERDPPGSGVYVPKATKYPWAPDAYIAFPAMYFDYEEPDQPATRRTLFDPARKTGSGLIEAQVAVSRDGVNWRRLPRPAYVGPGEYQGRDLHQIYMAEGMIRRGDEIWQYFYGQEDYHSPHVRNPEGNGVYRVVQRLDGFVSLDAPYDKLATLITRPLVFTGSRLVLNIDTGAMGYAQAGFVNEAGEPISGFGP